MVIYIPKALVASIMKFLRTVKDPQAKSLLATMKAKL